MTTIAVPTESPEIVCPSWCTIPYAEHVADLPNWEGFVIHWSAEVGGVSHARNAFVDNTADPDDPPLVHIYRQLAEGLPLDEAEAFARQILAAVAEARS